MANDYSDTKYRGDVNEKGWKWHGDLECYENPENWTTLRMWEEDGEVKCRYVLLGKWTHEVQVKELDYSQDKEQETYRYWLENRKATGRCAVDLDRWRRENT